MNNHLITISKFLKKDKNNNIIITTNSLKKFILLEGYKLHGESKIRFINILNNVVNIHQKRNIINQKKNNNINFILNNNDINIIYKNKIYELINYFTNINNIPYINKNILNKNDQQIFSFIKKHLNIKQKNNFQLLKISDLIEKYLLKINKYSLVSKDDRIKYKEKYGTPKILDFGCGNGNKIKKIKSFINLDTQIFGTDIDVWGNYDNKRKFDFTFKTIQMNPYKIPFPDNYFDCITCFLTLHHIKDLLITLNEINRILKKDGFIILYEHDVWYDYDSIIINIQHDVYQYIYSEKTGYYSKYYNFYEWDLIFNECGFYPIYGEEIKDNITFSFRYDNQFVGIYKKK